MTTTVQSRPSRSTAKSPFVLASCTRTVGFANDPASLTTVILLNDDPKCVELFNLLVGFIGGGF